MPTENDIYIYKDKELKKIFDMEFEPWMKKLSVEALEDVSGFLSFVGERLREQKLELSEMETQEFRMMQDKLFRWRQVAKEILPINQLQENFIDLFTLPSEPFDIVNIDGSSILVLESLPTEGGGLKKMGFVFDRCLRKVKNSTEQREIYRAVKCEVDWEKKSILSVFKEQKFVIKRVGKYDCEELNERMRREFKTQSILSELNHPSINSLVAYMEDKSSMLAVSFSAGEEDLLDALKQQVDDFNKPFSEDKVKKLFRPAIEALVISHNLGIAHRDLSLENFCVNVSEFDLKESSLQIIDWGHSASSSSSRLKYEGPVGKERYFSPELLSGKSKDYDPFKADVFALGVSMFSSLIGQMPFERIGDNRSQILEKGVSVFLKALKKDSMISEEAKDLLTKCLKWNPEERFSMKEVLLHPFFN